MDNSSKTAAEFLRFVNISPTPFHAVEAVRHRLVKSGFNEIKEREDWATQCIPGGKYYLVSVPTMFCSL